MTLSVETKNEVFGVQKSIPELVAIPLVVYLWRLRSNPLLDGSSVKHVLLKDYHSSDLKDNNGSLEPALISSLVVYGSG